MKLVTFGIDKKRNVIIQFPIFVQPYTPQPQLFVVRHKSRYSCKSAIYFDLEKEIIKQNGEFKFYYNETDVTPTVLNGGNEIILAN